MLWIPLLASLASAAPARPSLRVVTYNIEFGKGGLGDLAKSWVSTGANKQLTAEQLKSVLGADTLKGLAGELGTSEEAAASKVAGALPQIVDKLTPNGEVPGQEALAKRLSAMLK